MVEMENDLTASGYGLITRTVHTRKSLKSSSNARLTNKFPVRHAKS